MRTKTRVLKFLFAGATAALIELGLFSLLIYTGIHPVVAQAVSFFGGVATSFVLNFMWVFDARSKSRQRFAAYCLLASINLIITSLFMQSLYSLGVNEIVAKIAIMGSVAIWNYFLFSKVIFKGSSE